MKHIFFKGNSPLRFILTCYMLLSYMLMNQDILAQVPQAVPYQAVARDTSGNILANQTIKFRFSVRHLLPTGTIQYQETHLTTTSSLGLVNLSIGSGTPTLNTFAAITWGTGDKYLQVEIDPAGGNNFHNMGTNQLLSVPFALYAGQANLSSGWSLTGNAGTDSALNFMGTTDNRPVTIKIAGTPYWKFTQNGSLQPLTIQENVSIGKDAQSGLAGNQNVAIGLEALKSNTNGSWNVAIGKQAGALQTNVNGNVLIGNTAGANNNSGQFLVALGDEALRENTTGNWNVAIGSQALMSNDTGQANVAVGRQALLYNQSSGNTAIGHGVLYSNTLGQQNTGIGAWSLFNTTTGNNNTGIGTSAGWGNTTGSGIPH